MTNTRMLAVLPMVLLLALAGTSSAGEEQLIELYRSDLKTDKVAVLTVAMDLNDAESEVFWPIHREYDLELSKLGDRRLALLKKYGKSYESLPDDEAGKLAKEWFKLQEDHGKLKKKYYDRVRKALSATVAVRFLQVEHQIGLLLELALASEVPLVKPASR